MSLKEIETLLLQIQTEVKANTAVIATLNKSLSNYATTDDLSAISNKINTLQNNNILLQDAVAALNTSVKKIDHLSYLQDIVINNISENDILQYGNDGKWHNIQPSVLNISGGGNNSAQGATKLSDLTDVYISGVSNGQVLVYSSINSKWINSTISNTNGGSTDLSKYLTISDAQKLYLPLSGGTVEYLNVKGLTTLGNDLLVTGGITMYNK